jgi:hypothetical protein
MADEEAKEEEVKQNQNIDPDEEGLPGGPTLGRQET